MNRRQWLLGMSILGVVGTVRGATVALPALPSAAADWINSPPLGASDLSGRPVLIEFWTFGCVNCRNTLSWLEYVHRTYAPRGLTVIGVHTPEFAIERDPANVRDAVRRLGLRYPVVMDPDAAYWRALGNRYWPAFWLFDARRELVARRDGELHAGDAVADSFEREIAHALVRP